MNWSEYVRSHVGPDINRVVSQKVDVTEPTVSRWKKGTQGVDATAAARFARAYNRPVLEAFVAAGFLTAEEARARPSAAPDYTRLTNDELLDLVRSRMTEGGGAHGDAAPMNEPTVEPDERTGWDEPYVRKAARDSPSAGKAQRRELEDLGEESQATPDGWEGA